MPRILVTGGTGYVGRRLLESLLERGTSVRCLARRPEAIPPRRGLETVPGMHWTPRPFGERSKGSMSRTT